MGFERANTGLLLLPVVPPLRTCDTTESRPSHPPSTPPLPLPPPTTPTLRQEVVRLDRCVRGAKATGSLAPGERKATSSAELKRTSWHRHPLFPVYIGR